MNIYSAFWKAFRSRPLEAIGAMYWHLTGRRVRARNRLRISLAQSPQAYPVWIRTVERQDLVIAQADTTMSGWRRRPVFSILVRQAEDWPPSAVEALASMMGSQIYPGWEVVILRAPRVAPIDITGKTGFRIADVPSADERDMLRIGVASANGDYVLPLPEGARLPATSLYHYAESLQDHPASCLLLGDNDWIDARGERRCPWFKPQWNQELAFAQDYLSQAMVIARGVAQDALHDVSDGRSATYALALAIGTAYGAGVRHVPHIQAHMDGEKVPGNPEDRLSAVQSHLDRMGARATISVSQHDIIRVDWPLPEPRPLVSIIIPTRDKLSLLRPCVESLLARTSYEPFEVLIVDNGSREANALAYLEQIAEHDAVRVLRDDRPYNFSQLNNFAVAQATGTYLCLLNNDTEIIDDDWLTAMMRHAVRPNVAAVGARLLYADGAIQHAGVTVGLGAAAGHAHRFSASAEAGYFARTHAAHDVSAVTAACLVVSKDKFLAVGGLDEQSLAIAFNDVDLCLKLQAAGWRNVYTPYATLFHHESKSRGKDISPQHIDRYRRELLTLQERWGTTDYADPLHHESLDRSSETYLIKL